MVKAACLGVICLWLFQPSVAHAQFRDWRATADLHMDTEYVHATQTDDVEERDGQASFGLRLRATAGKNVVHYAPGFSYQLGSSFPGGFVYAVELMPLGIGLVFSDRFRIVVRGGAGVSGTTSHVPFAGDFPIEAQLDTRLTRWLAFGAFARVSWTTSAARDGGVTAIDFGHELRAGVRLRFGKHYRPGSRMRGSDGYYLAAVVTESLGSRFVGGAFGYAIDFAAGR